jgi:hypothetical protein
MTRVQCRPLPDDNPDALRILLEIVHFRNRQVPKKVSFAMLTHLSILVDKYQMLEAVEPFANLCVADVDMQKTLPSYLHRVCFPGSV